MKRTGIIAGGNWIVDHHKVIDSWPEQDTLTNIREESRASGGSPYNILKDLRRLDAPFPLEGVGLVGNDALGRWILADCRAHGIGTRQLQARSTLPTSYTDVMNVRSTGHRTYFHQRGANSQLSPRHFDFRKTRAKFFHLGYLLLLDGLDSPGEDGRPRACEVLSAARKSGLLVSIDLVSEASDRFSRIVPPVLPEVDYLFINEYEAARATGIKVLKGRRVQRAAVERAASALLRAGVRREVFIHFPEAVYARKPNGAAEWHPALNFPQSLIQGTAGAGDAFAAGVLYGLHQGWPTNRCLLLGVSAAATCLTQTDCSEGVLSADKCLAFARKTGLRRLPVGW